MTKYMLCCEKVVYKCLKFIESPKTNGVSAKNVFIHLCTSEKKSLLPSMHVTYVAPSQTGAGLGKCSSWLTVICVAACDQLGLLCVSLASGMTVSPILAGNILEHSGLEKTNQQLNISAALANPWFGNMVTPDDSWECV